MFEILKIVIYLELGALNLVFLLIPTFLFC